MTLVVEVATVFDPEGHGPELAMPGDWVYARVSDGEAVGWGEASHSGDDAACCAELVRLAATLPGHAGLDELDAWHGRVDQTVAVMVAGTAVSALDQAIHELVGHQRGVPVWRLFVEEPVRRRVPAYVTINRALTTRDADDYVRIVGAALEAGWTAVKCAPFDAVRRGRADPADAREGIARLALLLRHFPGLDLRVDCHERFDPETYLAVLPALDDLGLTWIEAPCALGEAYADIRAAARTPIAAGETLFGVEPFAEIVTGGWVDVILPDVKHVGGLGPLLRVCEIAAEYGVEVSPHNPSGPVSTAATLHAAAVAPAVTSLEIALRREGAQAGAAALTIPQRPGWGLDAEPALPRLSFR